MECLFKVGNSLQVICSLNDLIQPERLVGKFIVYIKKINSLKTCPSKNEFHQKSQLHKCISQCNAESNTHNFNTDIVISCMFQSHFLKTYLFDFIKLYKKATMLSKSFEIETTRMSHFNIFINFILQVMSDSILTKLSKLNRDDFKNLVALGTFATYENRVYLAGPCNIGKSSLASILIGEEVPKTWFSTDGLIIHFGRNGIDLLQRKMIPLKKGK